MKRFILIFAALISAFTLSPTFAQEEPPFGIIPAPKLAAGEVCKAASQDLGCKIKTGRVQLKDFPRIVIHLIDLFSKLAGTISVIILLIAGWLFIFSGLTEDKEKAKNTLKYALIGLTVTMLAWVIVNVLQTQLTR